MYRRHSIADGDMPIGALGMAFNKITTTLELLSYYNSIWSAPRTVSEAEATRARTQNGERVMLQLKSMYIMILSGIEFAAKQAVDAHPTVLMMTPTARRYLYLWDILKKSRTSNFFDQDELDLWDTALVVRHVSVHNNGIPDRDMTRSYPNGLTVVFQSGVMSRGNLKFFVQLGGWVIEAYARWCDEFISRATSQTATPPATP